MPGGDGSRQRWSSRLAADGQQCELTSRSIALSKSSKPSSRLLIVLLAEAAEAATERHVRGGRNSKDDQRVSAIEVEIANISSIEERCARNTARCPRSSGGVGKMREERATLRDEQSRVDDQKRSIGANVCRQRVEWKQNEVRSAVWGRWALRGMDSNKRVTRVCEV